MKYIKNVLVDKVGYIAVFFFLVVFYGVKEYPAPYYELEKRLFLLFQPVSGVCGSDNNKYLPSSNSQSFYKKFWLGDENYKTLNKKLVSCWKICFLHQG